MILSQDRELAVTLINEARNDGARLKQACTVLNITDRTYQRRTEMGTVKIDQRPLISRPTPANKISEEERKEIMEILTSSDFTDLPPSQIVPKLADQGIYIASESTFNRILRDEKNNAHRSRSKQPTKKQAPTHIAIAPNEVWTWDITWLNGAVKGKYYKLYLILDMFSRMLVGYELWEEESSAHAEDLVKKSTLAQGIAGRLLVLYSDNGSPMKAATFLATLEKLGVQHSFSRPRVSNDNPYSESLFKTLKYRPTYQFNGFQSLMNAREWVAEFVNWYNTEHLHSSIQFITPYQRHYGRDVEIMAKRTEIYKLARARNPERWVGEIRNWSLPNYVSLNPMKQSEIDEYLNNRKLELN